jgi:hypothetical protein
VVSKAWFAYASIGARFLADDPGQRQVIGDAQASAHLRAAVHDAENRLDGMGFGDRCRC